MDLDVVTPHEDRLQAAQDDRGSPPDYMAMEFDVANDLHSDDGGTGFAGASGGDVGALPLDSVIVPKVNGAGGHGGDHSLQSVGGAASGDADLFGAMAQPYKVGDGVMCVLVCLELQ